MDAVERKNLTFDGMASVKEAISVLGDEGQAIGAYWEAAQRSAALGCKRATRPVMRIVRESAEANRRAAALHALWLLGDPRATPLLLRVAADGAASEKERIIAVEELGMSARRQRVQKALAQYLGDPLPMVRYSALCAIGAAWACGTLPGPALREALHRATLDTTRVYDEGDVARLAAELLTPPQFGTFEMQGSSEEAKEISRNSPQNGRDSLKVWKSPPSAQKA